MKVETRRETKIIRCLEVALYQSQESKMKQFTEESYLAPVCAVQPSSTLTYSTHMYISCNKNKDYIFVHQHCYLSLLYNNTNKWTLRFRRMILCQTSVCLSESVTINLCRQWKLNPLSLKDDYCLLFEYSLTFYQRSIPLLLKKKKKKKKKKTLLKFSYPHELQRMATTVWNLWFILSVCEGLPVI